MQPRTVFLKYGGLLFGIILLAAVIGIASHLSDGLHFIELLEDADPAWLAFAVILQFGTYPANAGMWHATLRRAKSNISWRELLRLSVAKLFVDQAAPSAGLGGSLLVMEALAARRVPRSTAVRALLIGLTGYYVAYTILFGAALLSILALAHISPLVFWTALLFGILVLIFILLIIFFWSGNALSRLPNWIKDRPALEPFLTALAEAPVHLANDWRMLGEAALAAGCIFLLDAISLWVILIALNVDVSFPAAFASFMMASAATTIGLVPGGLGIFEGAATAMLVLFGVDLTVALAAVLILRGLTYWLPMLPGIFITRRELRSSSSEVL